MSCRQLNTDVLDELAASAALTGSRADVADYVCSFRHTQTRRGRGGAPGPM